MKSIVRKSLILLAGLLCIAGIFLFTGNRAYADDAVIESAYAKLYVNDLAGYTSDSATVDPTTNNVTNVSAYGRFGYNDSYQNVEITSILNFSTIGNTTFILRAQGDSLGTAGGGWTNSGYYIRWYPHGQFDFCKNGAVLQGAFWGSLPGSMTTDTDYTVVFKTVNKSDGSVQITFTINGYVILDYNDSDSPLLEGGWYAVCSEGSVFSARGYGFDSPVLNLADVSAPILSANFSATLDGDNVVTSGANSGVGYALYTDDSYTYKTTVTASANVSASSAFSFTIGASKTNAAEINRPNVVDPLWGWSETGYVLRWYANGQRHLGRAGNDSMVYVWDFPTYSAGDSFDIEYGITNFDDGSVRIHLKIDGNFALIYFDRPREGYTPLSLVEAGGQPSSTLNYALVLTHSMDGQITNDEKTELQTLTLTSTDLGTPISGGAGIFDRNGSVSNFGGGIVGAYPNVPENSSIKMKANFTATTGNLVFTLASQGTLDTPWGTGWTRRGYQIYYYANGQTILYKNGEHICEGWAIGGYSISPNTDYTLEVGSVNIDGAIRVYAKIDDIYIINYLDYDDALVGGGTMSIYSGGFAGKLDMAFGKPEIYVESTQIDTNDVITLGYTLDGQSDGDSVQYFIDNTTSTAQAEIDGTTLRALSAGTIDVYVCVNGVYSDNLTLTVEEGEYSYITNLPTSPLLVGDSFTFEGALSSGEIVDSISYSVEAITGNATIDDNGTLTATRAGTVRVYVTINGLKSEGYLISITTKVEVANATAMAVGEVRKLSYWTPENSLPDEEITESYEIIDGEQYITFNPLTSEITANSIGVFTLRVTITGESFSAVSAIVSIPIEAPIVTLQGVEDMYVGQTLELYPKINDGVEITSKNIVIVSGQDILDIDEESIVFDNDQPIKVTALKSGTVRIKAVINGIESKEFDIVVSPLQATIIVNNNMIAGSTQNLSVMFNFQSDELDQLAKNAVFTITSGQEYARIEGNTLIANDEVGSVTIQATVGDYSASATVNITSAVIVAGITNNQEVVLDSKIRISFLFLEESEVESVELVILEGEGRVKVERVPLEDDELASDQQFLISALDSGRVRFKLVVNGISSEVFEFNIYENTSTLYLYVLLIAFSLLVVILLTVFITTIILSKKKNKKLAKSASEDKQ